MFSFSQEGERMLSMTAAHVPDEGAAATVVDEELDACGLLVDKVVSMDVD